MFSSAVLIMSKFTCKERTHFLGKAAGSLRIVRAACTMAMGVATYPLSEDQDKQLKNFKNFENHSKTPKLVFSMSSYLVPEPACGSWHWVCPEGVPDPRSSPLRGRKTGRMNPPSNRKTDRIESILT